MIYLMTTGMPINYNSTYLVGTELINKIDAILGQNSTDSYLYNNLVSEEVIYSNNFHPVYAD